MSEQTLNVVMPSEIVYVTGSVNGVDKIFTKAGANLWTAQAARTADYLYDISLIAVDAAGNETAHHVLIFTGICLVFDRTAEDVANDTWRGQYNYTDLNRVESAVEKLAAVLRRLGHTRLYPEVKTDWHVPTDMPETYDTPTVQEMRRYLGNVGLIRGAIAVMRDTPTLPEDMRFLDYLKANDIEKALYDVFILTENIQRQAVYCGVPYCGEV